MSYAFIVRATGAKPEAVRQFASRYRIPRERKQGQKGVFVDIDAYIAKLLERGYFTDAERLKRAKEQDSA